MYLKNQIDFWTTSWDKWSDGIERKNSEKFGDDVLIIGDDWKAKRFNYALLSADGERLASCRVKNVGAAKILFSERGHIGQAKDDAVMGMSIRSSKDGRTFSL